jgi:hypothetical protein
MAAVFISYRADDSLFAASIIDRILTERLGPAAVFRDSRSIEPGAPYPETIWWHLGESEVLLAVIGPNWLNASSGRLADPDDWVCREIAAALEQGKRVIPVLLDGATMPTRDDLPPNILELAKLQAARVSANDLDHDISRLINFLVTKIPALVPFTPDVLTPQRKHS